MNEINRQFFDDKKKQIYNIIKYAKEWVPYYRYNYKFDLPSIEDFSYEMFTVNVPIINKYIVKKNGDLFISDKYNKQNLVKEITSGSEGRPLICYKSPSDKLRLSKVLWQNRRTYIPNLSYSDKFTHFYVSSRKKFLPITTPIYYESDTILHLSLFDLSEDVLLDYWNEIIKFQPRWIHGVPSTIYSLATIIEKNKLADCNSLEFIELTGEFIEPEKLKYMKRVFKSKISNQYGAREFWGIAYSCSEDKFHIIDESVFVESIFNEKVGKNELFVTSLTNKAWPLVRYSIGDSGKITTEKCSCESPRKYILKLESGRTTEVCSFSNGKIVGKVLFSYITRKINGVFGENTIKNYQVRKKDNNRVEVLLCAEHDKANEIIEMYKEELVNRIGKEIFVDVKVVDFIAPSNTSGKLKEFINLTKTL